MDSRFLMTLELAVGTPQMVGATPHGTRRVTPLSGGSFEGPRLRGKVLSSGGADWQIVEPDGTLQLDIRLTLETDDGALVYVVASGVRHGPPDVLAALGRGEKVDPSTYYFRITLRFETAHPKYEFLNRMLAVATGDRRASGPIYSVYEIV